MSNKDKKAKISPKKEEIKEEKINDVIAGTEEEQPQEKATETEQEKPLTKEEELTEELKKVQAEIDEYKDKYLRLAAEFDNYRKRTMKEKAELILNGSEKSINSILPVLDDIERAIVSMEKAEDVKSVKDGVELIYSKFVQILRQNGVREIETKDQQLNTDYHEAIAMVPVQDEKQKGKIIDCTQKGYTLNEKVIRHAKVVIGQ